MSACIGFDIDGCAITVEYPKLTGDAVAKSSEREPPRARPPAAFRVAPRVDVGERSSRSATKMLSRKEVASREAAGSGDHLVIYPKSSRLDLSNLNGKLSGAEHQPTNTFPRSYGRWRRSRTGLGGFFLAGERRRSRSQNLAPAHQSETTNESPVVGNRAGRRISTAESPESSPPGISDSATQPDAKPTVQDFLKLLPKIKLNEQSSLEEVSTRTNLTQVLVRSEMLDGGSNRSRNRLSFNFRNMRKINGQDGSEAEKRRSFSFSGVRHASPTITNHGGSRPKVIENLCIDNTSTDSRASNPNAYISSISPSEVNPQAVGGTTLLTDKVVQPDAISTDSGISSCSENSTSSRDIALPSAVSKRVAKTRKESQNSPTKSRQIVIPRSLYRESLKTKKNFEVKTTTPAVASRNDEDESKAGRDSENFATDSKPVKQGPLVSYNNLTLGVDYVQKAKQTVEKAIKTHKVFCIIGCFPAVRRAMKKRGWVEKFYLRSNCCPRKHLGQKYPILSEHITTDKEENTDEFDFPHISEDYIKAFKSPMNQKDFDHLCSRLLKNYSPNFIWITARNCVQWKCLKKEQIINRFSRAYFTTKVGLHQCLQQLHWFTNRTNMEFFPRCYQVCVEEERQAFIDDFRMTACISTLKWFIERFEAHGAEGVQKEGARVRRSVINFCSARCYEFINQKNHKDLDEEFSTIWEHQWEQFLTEYYLIVHEGARIQLEYSGADSNEKLYLLAKQSVNKVSQYWSQIDIDGMYNIWIIKPGSSSRGRGIIIGNKIEKILSVVGHSSTRTNRYVVQKYIEWPLLIYNCKFDIRQWILITEWHPLVLWMYKDSYLRFCSQTYSLTNFHESLHLCNAAVQHKYTNGERSPLLPKENMWDSHEFQIYLKSIGHGDKWHGKIYPGMKQALIATLLSTQDNMEPNSKKNCFEIYGVDFILTSDFKPWLIEINSSPALGATTSVTARMCSQVLEDLVKVTVDRRRNKSADTGLFELAYRQQPVQLPVYMGTNLTVTGQHIDEPSNFKRQHDPRKDPHNLPRTQSLEFVGLNVEACRKVTQERLLKENCRVAPSREDLQALVVEAQRTLTANRPVGNKAPMIEFIDSIMSIPSSLQDQKSKVELVKQWIKLHGQKESDEFFASTLENDLIFDLLPESFKTGARNATNCTLEPYDPSLTIHPQIKAVQHFSPRLKKNLVRPKSGKCRHLKTKRPKSSTKSLAKQASFQKQPIKSKNSPASYVYKQFTAKYKQKAKRCDSKKPPNSDAPNTCPEETLEQVACEKAKENRHLTSKEEETNRDAKEVPVKPEETEVVSPPKIEKAPIEGDSCIDDFLTKIPVCKSPQILRKYCTVKYTSSSSKTSLMKRLSRKKDCFVENVMQSGGSKSKAISYKVGGGG